MPIRFLLGPAGSGKTSLCLAAIRQELLRSPSGPNLVFLAPKQATYQIERQLLEDPSLPGWSRLQILSFDRLARQILDSTSPVECLDEEGRLMVLRALLRRLGPQLRVFHAAARLTGFAQELSATLRELRNHHLGPDRLRQLASQSSLPAPLAHKLHDLALLAHAYHHWLADHQVVDADSLPDLATHSLLDPNVPFEIGGLWLDGFAEMTPQELDLLGAVVRRSTHTTLAFCLDHVPASDAPWLSTWSLVSQTFRRCHARLSALTPTPPEVVLLPHAGAPTRFSSSPALDHLAHHWTRPTPAPDELSTSAADSLRLAPCRDLESEIHLAAREILRHVRRGGRFRDIGVLVRNLEPFQAALQRVFRRFEIPFFLDRRESLAHHPLAELTRAALRLAASGWSNDDWFGALKTDLTSLPPRLVDSLENRALARGWDATVWRTLADSQAHDAIPSDIARAIQPTVQAFTRFLTTLGPTPDAHRIARALRQLWVDLDVHATLERWTLETQAGSNTPHAPHLSAWEQSATWLENLERGFGDETLPLAEWIPILDAGLTALTAGVIPSSQDQVLIGAIDRSRQPHLRLALVLGVNEGQFPAPPADGGMLTDHDRTQLAASGVVLGPDRRRRVGHERYFTYIAATRASRRLVLSWSERGPDGKPLVASSFVRTLQSLFPNLAPSPGSVDELHPASPASELAERLLHRSELLPWLLAHPPCPDLDATLEADQGNAWLQQARTGPTPGPLSQPMVEALLGPEPEVSVSALESLGRCPFQCFIRHSLRGQERTRFETDARRLGSLAHEWLAAFLEHSRRDGLPWSNLTPTEAARRFDAVAADLLADPARAVFTATPEARWQTENLGNTLRGAIEQFVLWAPANRFQPALAELAFGSQAPLPAWRLPLDDARHLRIRGKVDRVDTWTDPTGHAHFLVCDYKMRRPPFSEPLLLAGVELQLVAYALALSELLDASAPSPPNRPQPAGVFYIGLRGRPEPPRSRRDAQPSTTARATTHVHRGRFPETAASVLDARPDGVGSGQFAITYNRDGSLRKGGDALPDDRFDLLLQRSRDTLRQLGHALTSGHVEVAPYAHGSRTACQQCDLADVCRFDPASQPYRTLTAS